LITSLFVNDFSYLCLTRSSSQALTKRYCLCWCAVKQLLTTDSLAAPVVLPCVGPSVAPPSQLVPLGPDWFFTAYYDDRLKSSHGGDTYIRVLALLRRRPDLDRKSPTFYFRWEQSETATGSTQVGGVA